MTMNECPEGLIRDELPGYVLGTAGTDDRARIERHVRSCEACAAEVELLRAVGAAYRAPTIDVARVAAALGAARGGLAVDRPRARTRSSPFQVSVSAWRLAAAVGLMVITGATVVAIRQNVIALPETTATAGTPADSTPLVPQPGAKGTGSRVAKAGPATGRTTATELSFGGGLSDLSDTQLKALLAMLESIEASPNTEPEVIATPILTGRTEPRGGREQ